MGMTRLRFLSMVSSSFALAATRPARLLAAGPPMIIFSAEAFRPFINTTFFVHLPGATVPLNLDAILAGPTDPLTEQFTLAFSGPRRSNLPEGTYRITHAGVTPFDLHVNPAGVRNDGMKLYRADCAILKS